MHITSSGAVVTGQVPAGSPAAGENPVLIGASDGTNVQSLLTEAVGQANLRAAIFKGATQADVTGALDASSNRIGVWANVILHLLNGATLDRMRTPAKFVDINALVLVAGTGATIWTPGAGKKFRLMGGWFSSSAAAALIFGDNAVGTVIFHSWLIPAAGTFTIPPIGNGYLAALANNVLKLDCTAGTTVTGAVFGTEE